MEKRKDYYCTCSYLIIIVPVHTSGSGFFRLENFTA
jgi:hypothetical protein